MTNCKNCNAILTHNNGRIYCEYCGTVYNDYSHINPMMDSHRISNDDAMKSSGLYPDLGGDTDTIEVTSLRESYTFIRQIEKEMNAYRIMCENPSKLWLGEEE